MPYDRSVPLQGTKEEIFMGKPKMLKFRFWEFVPSSELQHKKIAIREENYEKFYVCSTSEYLPRWLHQPQHFPKTNEESEASFYSAVEDISESNPSDDSFISAIEGMLEIQHNDSYASATNELFQNQNEVNETIPSVQFDENDDHEQNEFAQMIENLNSLQISDEITTDIDSSSHEYLNINDSDESINISLDESWFEKFDELIQENKRKIFTELVPDCEAVESLVDAIKQRSVYYQERKIRKQELDELFVDAVLKTEAEKQNLEKKGPLNKRYVNLMKRLSINSQSISEEAIRARDKYNKAVKTFNETIQTLKKIHVTPEMHTAFTNVMYVNDDALKIHMEQQYWTAQDLYESKKYHETLQKHW